MHMAPKICTGDSRIDCLALCWNSGQGIANQEPGKISATPFRNFGRSAKRKIRRTKLEYMTPFDNRSSDDYDDGCDIAITTNRFSLVLKPRGSD